jgi:hypothetical protein
MESCHNCGLPEGASTSVGMTTMLYYPPSGKAYEKQRNKTTVWCCGYECAIQALGQALYGPATRKWPIPYEKFANKFKGQKTAFQTLDFKGLKNVLLGDMRVDAYTAFLPSARPHKTGMLEQAEA